MSPGCPNVCPISYHARLQLADILREPIHHRLRPLPHPGRPLSLEGAHCFGHNRHSIGICYEGGLDGEGLPQDTRTPAQKAALTQLLQELGRQFPASLTVGHCDLNPQKTCPSFDAVKEYKGHLSAVTLRSGVGLFL
ncbi:N-acetylmuramoyl-L-alanine amidase [Parabacteroides johnsonii]|uniref:N-acetylmuramoyl-L-alanine amidase n=1 Tax=Parabacteroides johnsonii TaxID=387661 RepID=UPI003742B0C9